MVRPRKAAEEFVAQNIGGHAGLRQPFGRHFAVKNLGQQTARGAVFQAVEDVAQNPKTRGHQTRSVTRMDAFGEDVHTQRAAGHAAQTRGQPQLVVVARAAVQTNHQAHVAQALAQHVHVRHQVGRATFFAGLDQAHDARVGTTLGLNGLYGRDAGVHRVTIVGSTTAIQLAVHHLRSPRTQVAAPTVELGLLVQVAIHQNGLVRGRRGCAILTRRGGQFKEQNRCARTALGVVQSDDFAAQAGHVLGLHPIGRTL